MDYKFGVTPEEETRVTPKIFPHVGHLSTEGKKCVLSFDNWTIFFF